MMAKANVYIVDDDFAVRDSMELLLGAHGFDTRAFRCGPDFLQVAQFLSAGCLLVDLQMPGMDGLELQQELRRRKLAFPLVVITGHGDVSTAVRAMRAGALDFVEKPFSTETILASIERALKSDHVLVTGEERREAISQRVNLLSRREQEVMAKMVEGHSNKLTAISLGLSPRTVEIHRARVMEKMQVKSLSELVRLAITVGIGPEN
jgi:two-component system response regulator FixJ